MTISARKIGKYWFSVVVHADGREETIYSPRLDTRPTALKHAALEVYARRYRR